MKAKVISSIFIALSVFGLFIFALYNADKNYGFVLLRVFGIIGAFALVIVLIILVLDEKEEP